MPTSMRRACVAPAGVRYSKLMTTGVADKDAFLDACKDVGVLVGSTLVAYMLDNEFVAPGLFPGGTGSKLSSGRAQPGSDAEEDTPAMYERNKLLMADYNSTGKLFYSTVFPPNNVPDDAGNITFEDHHEDDTRRLNAKVKRVQNTMTPALGTLGKALCVHPATWRARRARSSPLSPPCAHTHLARTLALALTLAMCPMPCPCPHPCLPLYRTRAAPLKAPRPRPHRARTVAARVLPACRRPARRPLTHSHAHTPTLLSRCHRVPRVQWTLAGVRCHKRSV